MIKNIASHGAIQRNYGRRLTVLFMAALTTMGLLSSLNSYYSLLNDEERLLNVFDRSLLFFSRSFSNERLLGFIIFSVVSFLLYRIITSDGLNKRTIFFALIFSVLFGGGCRLYVLRLLKQTTGQF